MMIAIGVMAVSLLAGCGVNLFKLEPVEPYIDADLHWTDENSHVSREHDSPEQRKVKLTSTTVNNCGSVFTIYIDYPIWWAVVA